MIRPPKSLKTECHADARLRNAVSHVFQGSTRTMARSKLILLCALFVSGPVFSAWTLDNSASELTVVSTKAVDIAEVHRFDEMAGRISDSGDAVITITLNSVNTGIDVRNERMRELLFQTDKYAFATVRADIGKDILEDLPVGEYSRMNIQISLDLHGATMPFDAGVLVSRLNENTLVVTNTAPVVLNAAAFNLVDGIEALRAIANLPSIGKAIPVSFVLTFTK